MIGLLALTSFLTTMPEYFFSVVNVAEGVFADFDNATLPAAAASPKAAKVIFR